MNKRKNVYFVARKRASASNSVLRSRDGAAYELGVSASTLADYELDNTKVVPTDKVKAMARLYKSPELENWYCKNVCPIGVDKKIATESEDFRIAVLQLIEVINVAKEMKVIGKLITNASRNEDERNADELSDLNVVLEDAQYSIGMVMLAIERQKNEHQGNAD